MLQRVAGVVNPLASLCVVSLLNLSKSSRKKQVGESRFGYSLSFFSSRLGQDRMLLLHLQTCQGEEGVWVCPKNDS